MAKSNTQTVISGDRIRWSFRHGASRENLDKIFAHFIDGGCLSRYVYDIIETDGDTTVFDVIYNPDTQTKQDIYLELTLVFRSLGLKIN